MERQSTNTVLMVRPANFGFNAETAGDNVFQNRPIAGTEDGVVGEALLEFDAAVNALRQAGIRVIVVEDSNSPVKPDAIFPNNWFSTHSDGTVLTYPMFSPARRAEVREEIIEDLGQTFTIDRDYTMSHYTEDDLFLEGTGSLVLDRINKVAYACLSPRTSVELLDKWAVIMGYKMVHFNALDSGGNAIYHTNVLMCIATNFVVICLEAIASDEERKTLLKWFEKTEKVVIDISFDQMAHFVGNMLEVVNQGGQKMLVCSQSAYLSLTEGQRNVIDRYVTLLPLNLTTIEHIGGGSARCMIAEIFLRRK